MNDLEDGGVERGRTHTKTARDWPKDQVLAEVTNTKKGVPGPKNKRSRWGPGDATASVYILLWTMVLGESLSERRTIDRPKRDNRRTGWGSNRNNGDDNNGDAKCVRGPMGEFRIVVRYRKGAETTGDSWDNR